MTMTQFAMVEELAFLVKDNLPSKHLILSMEETLVKFLQDETSSDGILELEPMDAYNRLLLHRLADIFGFAHVSIGEGVNRHLILERCPETSIPSVLVSDILCDYDEPQIPTISHQLLRRTENSSGLQMHLDLTLSVTRSALQHSLEERQTAYLAARERIFTMHLGEDDEPVKQKPRSDPVVARRMIAHALGQRINSYRVDITVNDSKEQDGLVVNPSIKAEDTTESGSIVEAVKNTISQSDQHVNSPNGVDNYYKPIVSSASERNAVKMKAEKSSPEASQSHSGRNGNGLNEDYLKREHLGAAKRMFSQALGKHCRKNVSSKTH